MSERLQKGERQVRGTLGGVREIDEKALRGRRQVKPFKELEGSFPVPRRRSGCLSLSCVDAI
ncbi:hypothetical protein A5678_04525 [Mycobacterium sp. E2733]|nr:hypothetical protein A5678_04525 [Mycobacterium sp. E2733]